MRIDPWLGLESEDFSGDKVLLVGNATSDKLIKEFRLPRELLSLSFQPSQNSTNSYFIVTSWIQKWGIKIQGFRFGHVTQAWSPGSIFFKPLDPLLCPVSKSVFEETPFRHILDASPVHLIQHSCYINMHIHDASRNTYMQKYIQQYVEIYIITTRNICTRIMYVE